MAKGTIAVRVVVPTVAVAVVASALAVVINLATEWKTNPWAWVGVVALTAVVAGVSLWLFRSQTAMQESGPGTQAHVERSVTGTVTDSTVIIGDGNQVQR